jgi:glycosyl transferase family 1
MSARDVRRPDEPAQAAGELERERARAEAAGEDASRAERELLEAQALVRKLEAQLATAERRLESLRRQPAVRVATGIGGRIAELASVVRSRSGQPGRRRAGRVPSMARSLEGIDRRDLSRHYRETLLAALHGRPTQGGPFTVAPFGPMDDLVQGLAARGIEATRDDPAPDAILVNHPDIIPLRLPDGPIQIGIHPAVSDDFDILVGPSDEPATAVVDALDRWLRATRVGIRIPAPNPAYADAWGDTHLARPFRNALRRAGWAARIRLRHVWDQSFVGVDDVVLDLLGLHEATGGAGAVRALWQISHPELARPDLYDRYDLAFVASDQFAARMAERVDVPVHPLHQATDPDRFQPHAGGPPHQLLFVGGWRQAGRRILEDLLPTEHSLAVYGGRWTPERIDPRYLGGEAIPNAELPAYYGAAAIVLNDHWAGMRREGFLSNRLYDAAAAGAFVISDEVEGLETEFDGGIVGYRDRAHLRELVDHFLANPEERRELSQRARRAVLERHTFDARAHRFIEVVEPLLARRAET